MQTVGGWWLWRNGEQMFYLKGAADTDLQPVVNMGEVGLTVAQTSNFSREAKVQVIF